MSTLRRPAGCCPLLPQLWAKCERACLLLALPYRCCRCILRWYLSRFNYKLRGSWDWLPAGTFAANMLGVTIDCALQVCAVWWWW